VLNRNIEEFEEISIKSLFSIFSFMPSIELKFPEPYKHEHPPVCDTIKLFEEQLTFSQKAADWVAETVGSWKFICLQTAVFGFWILMNITGRLYHWDPYPFILMNLVLSLLASYAASIILISQNLEERRDRIESRQHCLINEKAEEEARVILDHLTAQNRALAAIYEKLQELQTKGDNAEVEP
jgi:uncharacterized membrane protein